MNKRWLGLAAVAAVLVLPLVLGGRGGEDAKQVEVEQVQPRAVRASILASGNLVFREQAQLSPEVIGKVRAVLVEEGDQVAAGQVVLQLDEQVYRAEVAQQEAAVRQQRIAIERLGLNVSNLERQWKRSEELQQRRLIDEASHDQARHQLDVARVELRASREGLLQSEAMLNQARERLAKTEIRAPISGTVVAVGIEVGETAVSSSTGIAGSSLMTIANTDSLMTEVNVDEADIARIHVGQRVAVFAAAFPDTALEGAVESIPLAPRSATSGGQSEALARSYSVKVQLRDPEQLALRPGMTCRAEIFTDTAEEALAVQVQAVFSNNEASIEVAPGADPPEEEHYVWVLADGKAEKRVVEVGLSDDAYYEIRAGLKPGERVAIGPYKTLRHLKAGEALSVQESGESVEQESAQESAP